MQGGASVSRTNQDLSRRERIKQRNYVESFSEEFDWKTLVKYYQEAYESVLG